jgi:NTP pyrophosphatase (non-canonical NTP hydrolase)
LPVTFDEYQKAAARTMNPRLTDQEKLLDAAAGIAEEAGEVLAHVRKHLYQGKELDKERLAEELGDVLWSVTAAASAAELSLGQIGAANVAKLQSRWPNGMASSQQPKQ